MLIKRVQGAVPGSSILNKFRQSSIRKEHVRLSISIGYQLKRRERRKSVVLKNRCKIFRHNNHQRLYKKIKLYNDIECRESGTSIREWVTLVITLKSPLSAATPGGFKLQKNNSCTPCVPMFIIVWAKLTILKFAAEKVCLFMRDTWSKGSLQRWLGTTCRLEEVLLLGWLMRVDFLPPACWFSFCVPFIGFKRPHFYFPSFRSPRWVSFLLRLVLIRSGFLPLSKIFMSFVLSCLSLVYLICMPWIIACFYAWKSSLLISCRLWECWLQLYL